MTPPHQSSSRMGSAIEMRRTPDSALINLTIERRGEDLAYVILGRREVQRLIGRLRKIADDMGAAEARR